MNNDKFYVLQTMETYGGGFASNLAAAWSRADSNNSAKLMSVFGDLYAEYDAMYDSIQGANVSILARA